MIDCLPTSLAGRIELFPSPLLEQFVSVGQKRLSSPYFLPSERDAGCVECGLLVWCGGRIYSYDRYVAKSRVGLQRTRIGSLSTSLVFSFSRALRI